MNKSELRKIIREVILESQNEDTFKPGLYKLMISPSGDGRDWTLDAYVQLTKRMTKIEALRAIFKTLGEKFNDNDAFVYDFYPINPKELKIVRV